MLKITQSTILIFVCFAVVLFGLNISSFAQDKTNLYAEIAGDYEFYVEGQVLVIIFSVEDGALFGTAENDPDPPTPINPVEGKKLEFEATNENGDFFEFIFSRDEEKFEFYFHEENNPNSLSDKGIFTMLEDSKGNIWIGSLKGLSKYISKSDNFVNYNATDGLPN